MKFRRFIVAAQMGSQMIVCDLAQVRMLIVVEQHGKAFFDLLLDDIVDDGIGFPGAGHSTDHNRSVYCRDVQPSVMPFLLIVKARGQVDRVLACHKTGFLLKTFVLRVISVVHQRDRP